MYQTYLVIYYLRFSGFLKSFFISYAGDISQSYLVIYLFVMQWITAGIPIKNCGVIYFSHHPGFSWKVHHIGQNSKPSCYSNK